MFIFAVILAGWQIRRSGLLSESAKKFLNAYLVFLALPSIIILEILKLPVSKMSIAFVAANILPMFFQMLLVYIVFRMGLLKKEFAKVLLVVPSLGNAVYLGFPVVEAIFGKQALAYAALLSSLQSVFTFTVGFILFNIIAERKVPLYVSTRNLAGNTVLWSVLLGFSLASLNISFPVKLLAILSGISATALPVALFVLGMDFYGKKLKGDHKRVLIILAMKFLLLPALCYGILKMLSLRGMEFGVILLEHTMPPAMLNFILAKNFGFDEELTSRVIVWGTMIFLPLVCLLGG